MKRKKEKLNNKKKKKKINQCKQLTWIRGIHRVRRRRRIVSQTRHVAAGAIAAARISLASSAQWQRIAAIVPVKEDLHIRLERNSFHNRARPSVRLVPGKFVSFGRVGPSPKCLVIISGRLVIVVIVGHRIDGRAFGQQHLASSHRLDRFTAAIGFVELDERRRRKRRLGR